jgi:2-oxoglutarate ferredoxin oxidoreductase subunit alpha
MGEVAFWQGNQALAQGALAAGCTFFAGYPITPSSDVMEEMAKELPLRGGKFLQMEDEIASMAATIGGSLAGRKSMTASSGPGISLKQENLGLAYMAEVPLVLINVMRGGPSTGVPTKISQMDVMQARWGTHGDHGSITYSPASVQECYEIAIKAFNAAERYRQPVLILSDEVLGHMRESVTLPASGSYEIVDRKRPSVDPSDFVPYYADPEDDIPAMASFGDGYKWHVTGLTHNDFGFPSAKEEEVEKNIKRLVRKIDRFRDDIVEYDTLYLDDAEIVVLSYGTVSRSSISAVKDARRRGIKVGHFRPITLWPFPDKEIYQIAKKAKTIIVPELNCGQMVLEVERAVHGKAKVIGKSLVNGELFTPDQIFASIQEVA